MAVHDPLPPSFLAEWYQPAVVNSDIDELTTALADAAAHLRGRGEPIRLLTVLASPVDQVLYGVFTAASPDTVTRACRAAGVIPDRVTGGVHTRTPAPPAESTTHTASFVERQVADADSRADDA